MGLQITHKVLEMGYAAIVQYRTDYRETRELLQSSVGDKVHFLQYELTDSPEKLIDLASEFPVNLTGLVNNASVFTEGNLIDPDHLEQTLRINSIIPARLGSYFYKKIGKGWIIHITDANIRKPISRFQNYRISKIFLEELTRQQAFSFSPHMRVNAIAPGATAPLRAGDFSIFRFSGTKDTIRKNR